MISKIGKQKKTHFIDAPEVKKLAEEILIPQFHKHLCDGEVRVEYYFDTDRIKRNGQEKGGYARKVTSLNAFLARDSSNETEGDAFFVIVISYPVWVALDKSKKLALIDHELSHCGVDKEFDDNDNCAITLKMIPHDIEEFTAIVERHGMWQSSLEEFFEKGNSPQLGLFEGAK